MINEELIIKGCQKFDKYSQQKLFEMYAPFVKGICMRYASDCDEASDMLQETFIRLFSKINKFENKGPFKAWLRTLTTRTAINYYIANKKHKHKVDIEKIPENYNNSNTNTDENSFETILNAGFSLTDLVNAFQILPEAFRVVFNMYYIDNYKHSEIAEMLKIEEGTSKTRLLRSKQLLRNYLSNLINCKTVENLNCHA